MCYIIFFSSHCKCNTDQYLILPPSSFLSLFFSLSIYLFFSASSLRLCKLTACIANFLDRITRSGRSASSSRLVQFPFPYTAAPVLSFFSKKTVLPPRANTVSKLHILTRRCRDRNRDLPSCFVSVRLLTFVSSRSLLYPEHRSAVSPLRLPVSLGLSLFLRRLDLFADSRGFSPSHIRLEISLARKDVQFRAVRIQPLLTSHQRTDIKTSKFLLLRARHVLILLCAASRKFHKCVHMLPHDLHPQLCCLHR